MNGGTRTFRVPTLEDVLKHRVIVVTLSISMYLSTLGLQKGMCIEVRIFVSSKLLPLDNI
jgi:hypothetical protein